jgi:hypothetical protein
MHFAGLTSKELATLEKLQELVDEGHREGLVEKCAIELRISPVTVRTRLSRIRSKYRDAKLFMAQYREYQQKLFQKSQGKFRSL